MSKGRKVGPKFGQKFIKKLGFTLGIHFWTTCVVLVSFLYAPGLHFGSPWLILASFWELFGVFFAHFWRCMTCFWINSRPSGNLEESIFGSLIKGIFLTAFLESGRVHFRMVTFGRDSPAQIMHAEIRRDFGPSYTGRVLQWFQPTLYTQSSAEFSVSF